MPTQTLGLIPRKCSFIEPGVVNYADVGMVLVRKEVLDNMAPTMRGKPVIDKEHREVNNDDYDTGNFDGIVDSNENAVWFDPNDAQYHCSFAIKPRVLENIGKGFRVSCAYKVTKWGPGGIHNNVPYEREVLAGEYTHLAIVDNPRYEGVRIYNAKGAEKMKLLFWRKQKDAEGKEMENSVEVDASKSEIVLENGSKHTLEEGIAALVAHEEAKAKEADLKNSQPKDTDMVDIGNGQKRSVGEIKSALALKNSADKEEIERKNASDRKAEDDRQNAAAKEKMDKDHDDDKHKEKAMDNCMKCKEMKNAEGRGHYERVQEIANSRNGDSIVAELPKHWDGFAEGNRMFGSEKPAQAAK